MDVFIILSFFLWDLIFTTGVQFSDLTVRKRKERPASLLILKFKNFWRSFLNLLNEHDGAAKRITSQSMFLPYLGCTRQTGDAGKPEVYLQEN